MCWWRQKWQPCLRLEQVDQAQPEDHVSGRKVREIWIRARSIIHINTLIYTMFIMLRISLEIIRCKLCVVIARENCKQTPSGEASNSRNNETQKTYPQTSAGKKFDWVTKEARKRKDEKEVLSPWPEAMSAPWCCSSPPKTACAECQQDKVKSACSQRSVCDTSGGL